MFKCLQIKHIKGFTFTQSWILFVSFLYRIRQCFIQIHDSIQCVMCFFVNNQFRTCVNAFPNEFTVRSYEYVRVNIEFFTGRKKIKQRRISFVLGYLRTILYPSWCHNCQIQKKPRVTKIVASIINKHKLSQHSHIVHYVNWTKDVNKFSKNFSNMLIQE
jgi:hypothetical protein